MAELDHRPLIAWIVACLSVGCDSVAVNAPPDSAAAGFAAAQDLTLVPDSPGDPDGPLAGVRAGMVWAKAIGAPLLATAPCDTPFLPGALVSTLTDGLRAAGDGAGAAAARTADGDHPLCALWRVDRLPKLEAALDQPRHPPVRQVLAALHAVSVDFPDGQAFANLNTQDDHATAARRWRDARV